MKTIFAKFNRERLPCFQTVTKIIEENGVLKAIKLPLSPIALNHINTIYNNYKLLLKNYPHIKLCKPTLVNNGIEFEMALGESFEKLLKRSLDEQNKEMFFSLFNQYLNYLDSFVTYHQVKFEPCSKFIEIFGQWKLDTREDMISLANIDLVFSNLFVFNKEITQIDYEWVFNFMIPKSFIIWRSIIVFFAYYGVTYSNLINIKEIFAKINLSLDQHEKYLLLDKSFNKTVYGEDFRYLLNLKNMQPQIEMSKMLHELDLKIQQLENLNNTLNILKNSRSWKITYPIRKLGTIMRKFWDRFKKN